MASHKGISPLYILAFSRFVKSWSLVPQDFASVDMATTDTTGLKAWLFNHLPEQHAHRFEHR